MFLGGLSGRGAREERLLLTTIREAKVTFVPQTLRVPMRLSSGVITEITEARVEVTVEVEGKRGRGQGAIYLSDVWAWPDAQKTHEERDLALRGFCSEIAARVGEWCGGEAAHPTELGLRLHHAAQHDTGSPVPTVLARIMCASPFDAALHDAAGAALGRSAFTFYDDPVALPGADAFFTAEKQEPQGAQGAYEAIARVLRPPDRVCKQFDAWLCVSKDDALAGDIAPWIQQRGYRCFKLKIMGKDSQVDVARTAEIYRGVQLLGAVRPRLSVDSNEGNPDAASVLEYLQRLQADAPDAFAALEYLEQPTSRDILAHPHDWRGVTRLKPVILDEGLTGMELLPEVQAQGWSGIAIKTCKGHSFSLAAAAWARQRGLLVALQDLTNPGIAAIHSALIAAHVDTINGIEMNSPQYTPRANADWLPRLAGLLEPRDGLHHLPDAIPVGLGAAL